MKKFMFVDISLSIIREKCVIILGNACALIITLIRVFILCILNGICFASLNSLEIFSIFWTVYRYIFYTYIDNLCRNTTIYFYILFLKWNFFSPTVVSSFLSDHTSIFCSSFVDLCILIPCRQGDMHFDTYI